MTAGSRSSAAARPSRSHGAGAHKTAAAPATSSSVHSAARVRSDQRAIACRSSSKMRLWILMMRAPRRRLALADKV